MNKKRKRDVMFQDIPVEVIGIIVKYVKRDDDLCFALTCKRVLRGYRWIGKKIRTPIHTFFFTKSRFVFYMTMKNEDFDFFRERENKILGHSHMPEFLDEDLLELSDEDFFMKRCYSCEKIICYGCGIKCDDCTEIFCQEDVQLFHHNIDHVKENCFTNRTNICNECNNKKFHPRLTTCENGLNCFSDEICVHCYVICKECHQIDCCQCSNESISCCICDKNLGPLCSDCLKTQIEYLGICYSCNKYICSDCVHEDHNRIVSFCPVCHNHVSCCPLCHNQTRCLC